LALWQQTNGHLMPLPSQTPADCVFHSPVYGALFMLTEGLSSGKRNIPMLQNMHLSQQQQQHHFSLKPMLQMRIMQHSALTFTAAAANCMVGKWFF
jgi:hypothetical protein